MRVPSRPTLPTLLVAAGLCVTGLLLCPAARSQSAFPEKGSGDSGVVSTSDVVNVTGGKAASTKFGTLWFHGFDACTYTKPYDTHSLTFQQYEVAGCTPIFAPWIEFSFLATHGYAIYCPASAPYSWVPTLGGTVQSIASSQLISFNEAAGNNAYGPDPPAKYDYWGTSAGTDKNTWSYVAGCSPQQWSNVGDGGPYCCGRGPSGWSPGRGAALGEVTPVKGPSFRRTEHTDASLSITREVDLRPNRRRTHRLRCPGGSTLAHPRYGIGWYRSSPPSARDMAKTSDRMRVTRNGIKVAVRTKGIPRGDVRVQLSVRCVT